MRSPTAYAALSATVLTVGAFLAPAASGQAADVAPKEIPVYDTALADGWQNWSWAKAELSVEVKGSARKPIKVEAGPWQALYLHHDAFNTTGLKKLSLLIQGSAPDGQVRIFALAEGKPLGEGYLVSLSNTGWKLVEQPLAVLGAEDRLIDGIWVQNVSAADLPKFYVTEIKLQ
ncbi:MAG: hypothetical protein ABI769_10820 [Pseudomonadota bacterium]